MRALLITIGAGVGAPLRYLVDKHLSKRHSSLVPLETLFINISGSFVLGVTVHQSANIGYLFGTGLAGAFTTWSAFALETHGLFKRGKHWHAWAYLLLTLALGVGAAALGNSL